MCNAERVLVVLMRTLAGVSFLAVVPVFMPHSWMDACHRWLGLGPLPEQPIIVYLTRSLSAFYAFHAGVLWVVSRNVRRYANLVLYLALATTTIGAVLLWIDLHAGLPWFWTIGEGPFVIAFGLAMLFLQRRISQEKGS